MCQVKFKYNNHSQSLFYYIFFLSFLFVTGCSSTTPITVTHTEYIPPITKAGRDCISKIMTEYRLCSEGIKLETTACQEEAHGFAQKNHALALEDHALLIRDQKKQQKDLEQNRNIHNAREERKERECLDSRKRREAEQTRAYNLWRNNGGIGSPPFIQTINCSAPLPYRSNQNTYTAAIKKPVLKDFIEDTHCFSQNNSCYETYNRNHIICTGTVIKTTRCFANCNK